MVRHRAALLVALAALASLAACSAFMPEIGGLRAGGGDGGVAGTDDAAADGDPGGREAGIDAALDTGIIEPLDASGGDAGPMTVTVMVGPGDSHSFSPSNVTLRVGDTVHWVWSTAGHTVTSGTAGNADGLFCSPSDVGCAGAPTSGAGATYDHRFTSAGTFPYYCRPHVSSGMVGSITVQ